MAPFTPERLVLARMRRGLQKQELAERCSVHMRTVHAWEKGEWPPEPTAVEQISRVLRFPSSFFQQEPLPLIDSERASFRAMSSMKASQRDAVHAAGSLSVPLARWLVSRFKLPQFDVPDLTGMEPEAAANLVREHWGLGYSPAPNMLNLLEARGVRVFSLVEDAREVDAFSFWSGEQGFVMVNTQKTPEHGRFDAAHELGHLVLHRRVQLDKQSEHQANDFASAFLMPRKGIEAQQLTEPSLATVLAMKTQWHVSLTSMARRLHLLGHLSAWRYREMMIEIQQRGWRISEPYGLKARETSRVLFNAFGPMRRKGEGAKEVAQKLHLFTEELQRMIFGLVLVDPSAAPSIAGPSARPRPKGSATRSYIQAARSDDE